MIERENRSSAHWGCAIPGGTNDQQAASRRHGTRAKKRKTGISRKRWTSKRWTNQTRAQKKKNRNSAKTVDKQTVDKPDARAKKKYRNSPKTVDNQTVDKLPARASAGSSPSRGRLTTRGPFFFLALSRRRHSAASRLYGPHAGVILAEGGKLPEVTP
jgi:hypothetical protein